MINLLRHLFLDDFWLKLFSMILAVVVWLIVTFASQKQAGTTPRVFYDLPVTVLSSSQDVHDFMVSPDEVVVTVQGDPAAIQNLRSKDIRALVDLTGVTAARDLRKPIEVCVPAGITFMSVAPEEVQVSFPANR